MTTLLERSLFHVPSADHRSLFTFVNFRLTVIFVYW